MDFMYYGDTVVADLSKGTTETVDFVEAEEAGPGLAAGLALFGEYEADDPIVIGSGLLTGTTAPASCLGFVLGRSPLTGEPAAGPLPLFAGAEFKLSGFAMVVIKGESEKPVYLWLHDGVADIIDAPELAGLDTWQTTDMIRREMGESLIQVISIGPAGEAGSPLASYSINYWGSGDSAGLGAVMGAKNLKAVAVRGLGMLDANDPQKYYGASLELMSRGGAFTGLARACGEKGASELDGWLKPLTHRLRSCFGCPSACFPFVKYREAPDVFEPSGVEEPGMLVTSAAAALWLQRGGWEPEPACRAMEAMAREGVDMLRSARELSTRPLTDELEIVEAVRGLGGTEAAEWPGGETGHGLFGPWVPPLADEDSWLEANRVGFVLGVCPTYIMASGLEPADILALCDTAAGVELDTAAIAGMFDWPRRLSK